VSTQPPPGGLEALRELHPDVQSSLDRMKELASVSSNRHLCELASARVAELLGGERSSGAYSPPPKPSDAVVRDFVDQFVCDVARVTDEQVAALLEWMSPKEIFEFVNVLYVIDATERLRISLGRALVGGQ
jgi:hypothetical protein